MPKVTLSIALVLLASVAIVVCVRWLANSKQKQYSPAAQTHIAAESSCREKISPNYVEYCGSVQLGTLKLMTGRFSSMVSVHFVANAFNILECSNTSEGWHCTQSGKPVLEYPSEFSVLIEPIEVVQPYSLVPTPPFRLRHRLQPRRVVVRWLDSEKRILTERSSKFDEQVEAWTELQQPRLWYRAKVNGLSAVLASGLEAKIIGDKDQPLGTLNLSPNTFGAPSTTASLLLERK